MFIKRPKFWQKKNVLSAVLLPFSYIYLLGFMLRKLLRRPKSFYVPIICVGNIVIGGTGKTPFILKLIKLLAGKFNIAVISKGYGGNFSERYRVVKNEDSYLEVGDEPLLLAKSATTYVTKERAVAIEQAIKNGANLIILDDGFQDNSIKKSINLICFDGEYGVGNGLLLPAGPLRETLYSRMKEIDAVIIIGEDKNKLQFASSKWNFDYELATKLDKTASYIAFAGIGNPSKFFNFLKKEQINLVKQIEFPDHYQFTKKDIEKLISLAKQHNAKLLTTTKDKVKIPIEFHETITEVEVELKPAQNDTDFYNYLIDLIKNC
jgi:tetraacyldisaccharide 4'-kinase